MAKVIAEFSMSLDGFIADPKDAPTHIFDWYDSGDILFQWPGDDMESHVTPASLALLQETVKTAGAIVSGRRLFDITDGWGGRHPVGCPVFVVTHKEPKDWPHDRSLTTFVTDGVESAVKQAKAVAGDKFVGVAGPNIAQQCIDLGLLDEVRINLAPVVLGEGIPFFTKPAEGPVLFENPTVVEGDRVTHLTYKLRR